MLSDERKCRAYKAGKVPFSPEINQEGAKIAFLNKAIKYHQGKKSKQNIEQCQEVLPSSIIRLVLKKL